MTAAIAVGGRAATAAERQQNPLRAKRLAKMNGDRRAALFEIIARLERLESEAGAAGQEILALLLEQAKDEAERQLTEIENRPPHERNR